MLTANVRFYGKVLQFWLRGNRVPPQAIESDYDRLSPTYDDYFAAHVAKHARGLITAMDLPPGVKVLDLACGTGTLTLTLAEAIGPEGMVTGCDSSQGMLAVAGRKFADAGLRNVRFMRTDLREGLAAFDDGTLDAITCGWAIGYAYPPQVLRLAARKLKPSGKVGIIENVRHTLAPVKQSALTVAQTLPQHFRQLMDLHFRLPRHAADLERWFVRAGLCPLLSWEGKEPFVFRSGAEVLDWVLHTGASAGFDRVMDGAVRQECDRLFVHYIEEGYLRDGVIRVDHCYAAGIAERRD